MNLAHLRHRSYELAIADTPEINVLLVQVRSCYPPEKDDPRCSARPKWSIPSRRARTSSLKRAALQLGLDCTRRARASDTLDAPVPDLFGEDDSDDEMVED